jgi:AcrR family transcriptional regulator
MSSTNLFDAIIAQTKLSKKETSKQQKIVETAIRMFAEKGYANTSTSEIAKAAGVAEGTIFRHYGTKENLLLSVVLPFLKESIPVFAKEIIDEISPQKFDTFKGFLRAFINNRIEFIKGNKEIFQIVVKEFLYHEELRRELIPLFNSNVLGFINRSLDMFKARGEIADIPNNVITRMIFGFIGSYFAMRFILLTEDSAVDDTEEIDNLIEFIMNGVAKRG